MAEYATAPKSKEPQSMNSGAIAQRQKKMLQFEDNRPHQLRPFGATVQLKDNQQIHREPFNPIIQRAVDFDPDGGNNRGRFMKATDLNVSNVAGGSPTSGISIGGSEEVAHYKATQGSPYCKQMHLLNNHLGGSGAQSRNLGWGSAALNLQHHLKIEDDLNAAIKAQNDQGGNINETVIEYYNVRVDYYQPGSRKLNYGTTDVSEIAAAEKARGTMIEGLHFETRYKPNPTSDFKEKRGKLNDARGIDEMGSLAFNQHDQTNAVLGNNAENVLSWQDSSDKNKTEINNDAQEMINLSDLYTGTGTGSIPAVKAANVRSPRPPISTYERLEKSFNANAGYINGIFDGKVTTVVAVCQILHAHAANIDERFDLGDTTQLQDIANWFIAKYNAMHSARQQMGAVTI